MALLGNTFILKKLWPGLSQTLYCSYSTLVLRECRRRQHGSILLLDSLRRFCGTANDLRTRTIIKQETEVTSDHMTPEMKLHLITENCPLWHVQGDRSPFHDPFWAFYWPGGQVLTRYILDHSEEVLGRHVLDVGSGCGATAIGCKLAGATSVTANDIDPVALTAIRLNCEANNVSLNLSSENLIGETDLFYDVIVLGDMFYDADFANTLFDWITRLLENNKTILIGDPGRAALKNPPFDWPLQKVFQMDLPEATIKENNGLTQAWVWKCSKRL